MANSKIQEITEQVEAFKIEAKAQLEVFKNTFLSKKGIIPSLFNELKNVPAEERKSFGQLVNDLKNLAETKFKEAAELIEAAVEKNSVSGIDLSLSTVSNKVGGIHPLTATRQRIIEIFERIGFNLSEGQRLKMIGIISLH